MTRVESLVYRRLQVGPASSASLMSVSGKDGQGLDAVIVSLNKSLRRKGESVVWFESRERIGNAVAIVIKYKLVGRSVGRRRS